MPHEEHNDFALEVRNLTKTFGQGAIVAVDDVSLTVSPGEIVSVLGPSGCGKTTMMRIISGLEEPDEGDVLVSGHSVLGTPPHRRHIGLVFQDLAVFPHKTVFDNVAFGLRMNRVKGAELKQRVERALNVVQMPPDQFAQRMPDQLSGGQKQRVAVARTIVVEPSIVLFDEPMAALDRRLRDQMAVELRLIQKRIGLASVYVTHDQETASMMSDRIAVMHNGRIVQIGTPREIYSRPASRFVADFIGSMNFLSGRVVGADDNGAQVQVYDQTVRVGPDDLAAGEDVAIAIRPEHLRLSRSRSQASLAKGKLVSAAFVGGRFVYQCALLDGSQVIAQSLSDEFAEMIGSELWLEADPDLVRVFRN